MSEHTAGPWRAQILPVDRVGYKTYDFMRASIVSPCDYGDKRHVVAHIVEIGDETTHDEVSANAQLMAAAPDLLAVCKAIYRVADTASLPGPVHLSIGERNALRHAIEKAEGRSP